VLLTAALVSLAAPGLHALPTATDASAHASSVAPTLDRAHGAAPVHDQATCPQCIAIAQARTLLQSSALVASLGVQTELRAPAPRAPRAPAARAVLDTGAPRAPPRLSLAS
jgi:hypothetical protein